MTAARRPPEAAATDGTGDRPGKPGVNPLRVRKSGVDPIDSERNLATIAHAVAEGRFVLAYIHQHYWAEDWHDVPDWLTPFARDCVTAGAAAVVVHGVPLLQGIEIFRERPILYGLGNFVFHTHQPHKYPGSEAWEGLVVTARFDTTPALTELKLQPIVFGQHPALSTDDQALQAPLIARPDTAEQILQRVSRASSSFPLGVRIDTRSGTATWGEGVNG